MEKFIAKILKKIGTPWGGKSNMGDRLNPSDHRLKNLNKTALKEFRKR